MFKYEFIYRRENRKDEFHYDTFVRQTDRPITEQKSDIRTILLPMGIDKTLLENVDLEQFTFSDNLVVKFTFDNEDILKIDGVGLFPNRDF